MEKQEDVMSVRNVFTFPFDVVSGWKCNEHWNRFYVLEVVSGSSLWLLVIFSSLPVQCRMCIHSCCIVSVKKPSKIIAAVNKHIEDELSIFYVGSQLHLPSKFVSNLCSDDDV